jgi:hypothetical protein
MSIGPVHHGGDGDLATDYAATCPGGNACVCNAFTQRVSEGLL